MCKSVSGPIFGLCSEHLSVVLRGIGFIRFQTRRNATTSTIAEAKSLSSDPFSSSLVNDRLLIDLSVPVPCGVNSVGLLERGFAYNVLLFCSSNQAQRSNNVHDVF